MIFGLSTSHAAATLAIILVGYNIIIGETPGGEPIRLLDEYILNGTILLILMMEKAIHQAAATENTIIPLTRYDINISNGIIYTIKEQNISDVIIGLHKDANQKDFPGSITENILSKSGETIFIYKYVQPFNTLKRMVVAITPGAEFEEGFSHWFPRLSTIGKTGGLSIHFFADDSTMIELKKLNVQQARPSVATYTPFNQWEDFLILSRELKLNDFFVIVFSRSGHLSYISQLEKLPYYLSRYFLNNSFIIIYPKQTPSELPMNQKGHADNYILDALVEKVQVVNKAGNYISKIFRKKK